MTLGKVIQTARKQTGITQVELGEKLGVSGSMIGQWENDLRNPKPATVGRIAGALGEPFMKLFLEYIKEFEEKTDDKLQAIRAEDEALCKELSTLREEEFQKNLAAFVSSTIGRTIVDAFYSLNERGQKEAMERVIELTFLPWFSTGDLSDDWEEYMKELHEEAQDQASTKE